MRSATWRLALGLLVLAVFATFAHGDDDRDNDDTSGDDADHVDDYGLIVIRSFLHP